MLTAHALLHIVVAESYGENVVAAAQPPPLPGARGGIASVFVCADQERGQLRDGSIKREWGVLKWKILQEKTTRTHTHTHREAWV
jgi:hypothetical protein